MWKHAAAVAKRIAELELVPNIWGVMVGVEHIPNYPAAGFDTRLPLGHNLTKIRGHELIGGIHIEARKWREWIEAGSPLPIG